MAIERAFLGYRDDSIALSAGESIVGRHPECRIRFNDPAVSRRHMRFILLNDRLLAEDLGSANGTLVNNAPLSDTRELNDGDEIRLGSRLLVVGIVMVEAEGEEFDELTEDRDFMPPTGDRLSRPTPAQGVPAIPAVPESASPNSPSVHHCPNCRNGVPLEFDTCAKCGFQWPAGRPLSVTQRINIKELRNRRRHERIPVDMPVLYCSEWLSFDAAARNLSISGVFVASDLLDEVNTACEITLLPDGGQAGTVSAVVRRIVHGSSPQGEQVGMGIEFTPRNEAERQWLYELFQRSRQ